MNPVGQWRFVKERGRDGDWMRFQRKPREEPVTVEDVLCDVEVYLLVPRPKIRTKTDSVLPNGDSSPTGGDEPSDKALRFHDMISAGGIYVYYRVKPRQGKPVIVAVA